MFPLINPLPFIMTMSTLGGVLLHDTSLDKISQIIVGLPAFYVSYESNSAGSPLASDPHIHVERTAMKSNYSSDGPQMQPRLNEDKKYRQPRTIRGHYPFDDYNLPTA